MAEKPKVESGKKAALKVQLPVPDIVLPELSTQDSSEVLDQLCSLLRPIGEARRLVRTSKGKRAKKRDLKRKHGEAVDSADVPKPSLPEDKHALAETIVVGLNSVTRKLSAASSEADVALTVIFLTRPKDAIIYSHLPTLCAMASARRASQSSVRLVLLDENADARLAEALALPRVGVVGIVDESPWQGLVSLVRDRVPQVPIPGIDDISNYRSVRIDST